MNWFDLMAKAKYNKGVILSSTHECYKKQYRSRGNNDETCVVECKWASRLYEKGI